MKKQNKYRNIPTVVYGIKFASKKEGQRYKDLILMQKAGIVKSIELQKSYKLGGRFRYVCDFYVKWSDGRKTVEDVKGYRTQAYKVKKAWMKEKYNIDIVEI